MKTTLWVCAVFFTAFAAQWAEAANYLSGYGTSGSTNVTKDSGGGGYSRLNIRSGGRPSIIGSGAFTINRPHGDQSWKYKKKKRKVVKRTFRKGTPMIYRVVPAGNLAPRGFVTPVSLQE